MGKEPHRAIIMYFSSKKEGKLKQLKQQNIILKMLISDWLRISDDEYNNVEKKLDDTIDKQQIGNFWVRLILTIITGLGSTLTV